MISYRNADFLLRRSQTRWKEFVSIKASAIDEDHPAED